MALYKYLVYWGLLNLDVHCGVLLFLPDISDVVPRAEVPLQLGIAAEGIQTEALRGLSGD